MGGVGNSLGGTRFLGYPPIGMGPRRRPSACPEIVEKKRCGEGHYGVACALCKGAEMDEDGVKWAENARRRCTVCKRAPIAYQVFALPSDYPSGSTSALCKMLHSLHICSIPACHCTQPI